MGGNVGRANSNIVKTGQLMGRVEATLIVFGRAFDNYNNLGRQKSNIVIKKVELVTPLKK